MAGSHRAPRASVPARGSGRPSRKKAPPKLSARAIAVAVVIALVPAVYLGAQRVFGSDSDPGTHKNEPAIPPVTTAVPSITPSPSTPPPSAKPPASLTKVAVSVPRRLHVKGLLDVGFDDSISPKAGGFTAGSTAEAARWDARGKPGSPGTDTVYLIGKVYHQGASAFDDLPSVKVGTKIVVRTDKGVLTYTVRSKTSVPAAGLLKKETFTARVPGRLVLVGILFGAGDDKRTGKYFVVVAQLSNARKG